MTARNVRICMGEVELAAGGLIPLSSFFFFFQAEDGIRDLTVTGVQTCALPISSRLDLSPKKENGLDKESSANSGPRLKRSLTLWDLILYGAIVLQPVAPMSARSEERRVGKECRSRWSPYH